MLKQVRLVEIEIHSYCNRKCSWCPNKLINRNKMEILKVDTYKKILKELKNNNFNGVISYSRYNEPMANITLLKKYLKIAKNILPNIKLVSNTNGDYLSKNNLDNLFFDELSIMDYDCKGSDYCRNRLRDLKVNIITYNNKFIYGQYGTMKILYYLNWADNVKLEDRGGFFKDTNFIELNGKKINWKNDKKLRIKNCLEPKYFIGIDYNGNVVPCCHIRSDNPDHKNLTLGNIYATPLSEIYNSLKAKNFREKMEKGNYLKFPDSCKYCHKERGRYTRSTPGILYDNNFLRY